MGWTQRSGRVARGRRRPCLESLETRQLLSRTIKAHPVDSPAPARNADGSTNFDQIIGASAARSAYHVDGSGQSVAVIDTGVNYDNAALGGGIGVGYKVIHGVDFTGSPNGVLPTWQHGTGVAGLVGSNTPSYRGVAPGANIVALRVFGDNNQGNFGNIEQALDWVVHHHSDYNITAVNLSISDGGNYLANDFAQDGGAGQAVTSSIKQLDALNIPVVVAAGNSFNGKAQGQGFPAVVSDAISVTATDPSDKLASNAQRLGTGGGAATTLAAPGVGITAPADGNSFQTEDGTSFATPQVTGSIVLLQQMYENAFHQLPTVAQIEQLLQQGSVAVHDDATKIDIGRLNVLNSARILDQQIAKALGSNAGSPGNGATNPGSAGSPPPGVVTPPVQAPPQTEVFYNGVSIGSYATSRIADRYPNLFAFLKGPVGSIRIYGPKGSAPDLGASQPSGAVEASPTTGPKVVARPKAGSHAKALTTPKVVVHQASTPKKTWSFLSA